MTAPLSALQTDSHGDGAALGAEKHLVIKKNVILLLPVSVYHKHRSIKLEDWLWQRPMLRYTLRVHQPFLMMNLYMIPSVKF